MKKYLSIFFVLIVAVITVSSCGITDSEESALIKCNLKYSLDNGTSMYVPTKSEASDIFDEFYAKLATGELVAESYELTFTDVATGTSYSFSGEWEDAVVELQAATYKVTGISKASGEKTQEKCSIYFNETLTVSNQMPEIVLHAYYDCFLFVMTSESLSQVEDCYLFANKYWYAFVNDVFVDTLKGSHKDGSRFSVDMRGYSFSKGKYYVYKDVSVDEHSVSFLIPTMDNGFEEEYEWVTLSEELLGAYTSGQQGGRVLENKFYLKKMRIDKSVAPKNNNITYVCVMFGSDANSQFAAYWSQYRKTDIEYSYSEQDYSLPYFTNSTNDSGEIISDNIIEYDLSKYADKTFIWNYQRNVNLSGIQAYVKK